MKKGLFVKLVIYKNYFPYIGPLGLEGGSSE